jgi:hypothetical protein
MITARGDAVAREGRARLIDEAADVEWLITAADSARGLDDRVLGLHPNGVSPVALWLFAQARKSAP